MAEHSDGTDRSALARVEDAMADVAGVAALLIVAVTVADVVGRAVFSSPLIGAYETIEGVLLAFVVWFGIAQGARLDQHVAVGFLTDRLSARGQVLVGLVPLLLTAAMFGFIAVASLQRGIERWGYVSQTGLVPLPLGVTWIGVGLGCAVMTIRLAVGAAVSVRDVAGPGAPAKGGDHA